MKRNILVLVWLGLFLVLPNLALADCMDLGFFNSFTVTGGNTVTLYAGPQPYARFDVVNCPVYSTSKIQLIKGYVCDGDEILIDGSRCTVINVSSSVD
jgi:hypothetical protein